MAQTDVDQWAAAGASVLQQDRTEQIKASMGVALPGNPDQEAQLRRYAQQVGVPIESARAMPDQVKVQAQLSAFDAHGVASNFPATGQWLTNPDNARVAVDDVHQITQVEQAVRALHQPVTPTSGEPSIWDGAFWSKAGNYLIGGNPGNNNLVDDLMSASRSLAGKIGMGGALALSGITTTLDRTGLTSTLGDTTLGWAKYYDDQVRAEAAKPTEFHNKLIQSAATLGLQLPAIMATGGASEAPAMGMGVMDMVALAVQHGAKGMAIPAVTDAVHTMSQVYAETGDISKAARAAEVAYANTVAMGVVPLSAPGKLLSRLLGGAAVGATQGEVSRQALNAALPDGMQQPFDWETVALNAVTSSLMAGAMGPRAEPQRAAAVRAFNEAYEVARSDALNQQVSGLAEAANASKLRERDPAAFKQMVADFANRGDLPPVLHIDAGKLEQILTDAGVTGDELHQTMPRVAEQLDALRTGDGPSNVPVEIPVEDFATHIAGSELEKPLLAQMRVTPEGRTVAESETFRQEQQAEMTARAEQLDASHAADTEYQASLDKMNAQVDAQLAGLKMRPDQLTANSALLRAFYQVQAERLGIAPHEFAERHPVTGSNRALEDGGFDQITPEQARRTNVPVKMPEHAEFKAAVANTKGAEITPDGLRINLVRYQKPEQEGAQAIRTGVFYLPVGAATAKHYKTGKTGYGGTEKHEGETLLRAPLFVKGATGGKAPEAAYDQLKGKGAYGEMRADVLKLATGWGKTAAQKYEGVYEVLEKYGADPGLTSEILRNSKEGNTLPYAVQENIVAHAVREAGHDSVVGYSKGKEGPAISEVFDVREQTFPARGMDSQVHGAFEQGAQSVTGSNRALDGGFDQSPDTPAFKTWFGDSKVVDADGKPLVVYHGTAADFDSFDNGRTGANDRGLWGRGHYFSASVDNANSYALRQGDGARVIPAFVSIKNPLILKTGSDLVTRLPDGTNTRDLVGDNLDGSKIKRIALDGGHDGVVQIRPNGLIGDLVAFHPEQIKSATGNRGTFDPNDPSILNQQARGTYSPSTKTIALLKGANLSTFQHELGHFFLDTLTHMAAMPDAPAEVRADVAELFKWGGVTDLTDWHTRTADQQRELHEKFATGWETYLMRGQAPTLELRNLFARFRAWMTAVYKNLKGAPGDFTPEVQGVFDRMIASEAAIREAELARRYMPLFDAPGKEGIPLEEWAAYQAQGKDATEVAIEQLTGKSLRDMAAIDRLRTASLKSVQKDAAAKFKEIEREVRAEVMSQPVYRAWQFLTGKGEKDQQAQQDKAKASKELDPTQDSLLVAIAKLGGLDRESARKDLGVHQDNHKAESGVFGKPVFRKSGGLSADRMAEALAEHYYLPHDYSLHHLEDAIASELHGEPQYSWSHDYGGERPAQPLDPEQITHGKLRTSDLRETFGEKGDAVWRRLSDLGMTSDKVGVHPDMVADLFGFSSGDELVHTLAAADHPSEVVRGLAEQRMLERHGEIASPADMARTADALVANEVRAKFIATELKALKQAVGSASDIAKAAKEVAMQTIEAQRVRDIREGRYAAAGTRAARDAEKLLAKGDMAGAATAKRDQLLNLELTRAAREAKDWVKSAAEYLRKFDGAGIRKTVHPDYADQIDALLERFDLRAATTGKEIERRKSLGDWIKAQQEMGLEPDLPPQVLNEAFRTSYKDLKLSELKGLVDSIKQIEHLGKLKSKLLTAVDQRAYEAVRDEMSASIVEHAGDRTANTRTPTTNLGLALKGIKDFGFAHIKAATWARILDGGKEGGPVWEYLIRPANAAGDQEVTMRAAATQALHEIMAPLFKGEKMGGKGRFFPSIGRSLNRQERIAIALNTGNDGNMQRLLGGEGWTLAQIEPVLASITPEEARAVQGIWDHFETYRPMVGAMERRIYGKEPNWVEPAPIKLGGQDLRGGYYPVKYDPAASVRAEEHADAEGARRQVQGAYGAATVRRSFAKARAEEVKGRPLLYSLGGVYSGINETIHALAWSEWLIDANRLLKSTSIDRAVREHYGPEAVRQFKTWRDAVAEGEQAVNGAMDKALGKVRQSVSVAGLGFNVMSALMQPLGFTQSMVRLGTPWATKGLKHYLASPIESTAQANEMSTFMAGRTRTRFRELNEMRNKVQDQGPVKDALQHGAYWLMMRMQQTVDVPTWWGGYEKAIAAGNDEARSIALADQAVIDSQGSGQTKDLSAIEMGGQAQRLFTVFYSFMNTALNLGVASKMTPTSKARMAADMLLLYTLPAVVGALFKDAVTPGDSGNYDDPEKAAKKLAAEQLGFLASLMVVVREFGEAGKMAAGLSDNARGYTGPAGVRMVGDTTSFVTQAKQGEFDDAFRKAAINLMGDTLGLPSAQMNRTITGAQALSEGKTLNPAALALGYQEPR